MGYLDDLAGKVKEAIGGSGRVHSDLVNEVLGLLSGGEAGAGLQGLHAPVYPGMALPSTGS